MQQAPINSVHNQRLLSNDTILRKDNTDHLPNYCQANFDHNRQFLGQISNSSNESFSIQLSNNNQQNCSVEESSTKYDAVKKCDQTDSSIDQRSKSVTPVLLNDQTVGKRPYKIKNPQQKCESKNSKNGVAAKYKSLVYLAKCPYCTKNFKRLGSMKRHIEFQHKKKLPDNWVDIIVKGSDLKKEAKDIHIDVPNIDSTSSHTVDDQILSPPRLEINENDTSKVFPQSC